MGLLLQSNQVERALALLAEQPADSEIQQRLQATLVRWQAQVWISVSR